MFKRQYFLFTENPPLKSKGHGFSVLLYEIVAFNHSIFKSLITCNDNQHVTDKDINEINLETFTIDLRNINNRVKNYKIRYIFSLVKFFSLLPKIRKVLKINFDFPILVCIGTSSKILIYTWLIKKVSRNPVHIYLVDDITSVNKLINNRFDSFISKIFLKGILERSEKIYCISDGLKSNLYRTFGFASEVILPVFKKVEDTRLRAINSISKTDQLKIVFTGGLSLLYNDAIQSFDRFLSNYNTINKKDHQLIIQTYSPKKKFDDLNLSNRSIYSTSDNRDNASEILFEADVFLVPYSFNPAYKNVVATSFPQKFAQLIQFKKPILILAPDYSSLGEFCHKNDLQFLCLETSYEKINSTFDQIFEEYDYRIYDRMYSDFFSPGITGRILISNL